MCQFSIPFTGDAESLTQRAKTEIINMSGSFNGDSTQGAFRAKTPLGFIEGAYQIANQQIELSIHKKPFLLSCKRIEKELRSVMR